MKEFTQRIKNNSLKIAIIGMGYVGLPLAIEFSQKFKVIGFDINQEKIEKYRRLEDPIGDFKEELENSKIYFTSSEEDLKDIDVFIVTVPTPIDDNNLPDLKNIKNAFEIIKRHMSKKTFIILESTVYPGVTEEICIPILEKNGLKSEKDFWIGYSPERINPGDKRHTVRNIPKIVSGINKQATDIIEEIYEAVIDAPIYKTKNIKIAEAAKVIENTQRDINIAFVNELSIIFNKMGIDTKEVIQAAATKWNFIKYEPGLVGGHCVGVDPYYLAYKAKKEGIYPRIILAGRETNNNMGKYIAENIVKKLIKNNIAVRKAKVGILGITFKENCSDIRNSKVIDIIKELEEYKIYSKVYDPLADKQLVKNEYGVILEDIDNMKELDIIVLAVPHQKIIEQEDKFQSILKKKREKQKSIIIDVKRVLDKEKYIKLNYEYWGL